MALPEPNPTPANPEAVVRRHARRLSVAIAGGTTVVTGLILIPLPGPGTLIVLAGLSILGREFPKAHHASEKGKQAARWVYRQGRDRVRRLRSRGR